MDASIFWLILAMSLLIVEALTLGIFMLFFGFGAFITGMLLYVVPLSFEAQIIIFLSISIVLLLLMRNSMRVWINGRRNKEVVSDNIEDVLGRHGAVVEAINPPKYGLVDMNGTNWQAAADGPIAKGAAVEVVGRDNLVLKVTEISS
ncbi:MAG: NfeD family protein [Legionellales bacterium]|jgi:inner membrane protein|nr:NfeD family protein [Legionellales bacterium]